MTKMKIKLNQKAMYWTPPTADGRGGWTFPSPTEVSCRWEGRTERFISPEGREEVSRAVVYLQTAILADGWLWLGSEEDWDLLTSPTPREDGAYKIRSVGYSPSIDGNNLLYKAML